MKYIKSLDTLRAIAVLFVLLLHGSYGYFIGGWVGVDLFFVLSGYLITSILISEYQVVYKISITGFYIRRILRLFPPLIIGVILANILWNYSTMYPGYSRIPATFGALFYFTNILRGNISGNLSHLWSLSVEEHFYLVWPLLMTVFLVMVQGKRLVLLSLILILLTTIKIFLPVDVFTVGIFTIDLIRFTVFKIDGLVLGAIMAFIIQQWKPPKYPALLIIFLLLSFIIIVLNLDRANQFYLKGGFIIVNLICAAAVYTAVKCNGHVLFSNNLLNWVGKRSYGIYVYHFPIFLFIERFKHPHDKLNFALILFLRIAVTIIFAALSYRFIEVPVLTYKKRWALKKPRWKPGPQPITDL